MLGASWVLPSPPPAVRPRVISSLLPPRRRQVQRRASTKAVHWVAPSQHQPVTSVHNRLLRFLFGCCSVAQSCPTLCDPMDCSTPGFPVHHHLPEFAQTHVHRVGDAIQRPFLLLPPSPPSIRVFSNESTLRMRWPKYWSFNFSISPSKDHQD